MTWDGSKGGSYGEQEEKKKKHGVFFVFLERKIEKLQVFMVKNHKLCFDITQNLSVVLGFFFQQNMGLCYNLD